MGQLSPWSSNAQNDPSVPQSRPGDDEDLRHRRFIFMGRTQLRISSNVWDTGTVRVVLSIFAFALMMHSVQEAHICWAGWLSVRVEHCWKHWWCVRRQACCLGIELPFNRGRSIPQRFAGISSSKTKALHMDQDSKSTLMELSFIILCL